jgi:hypothetical protein
MHQLLLNEERMPEIVNTFVAKMLCTAALHAPLSLCRKIQRDFVL